MKELIFLFLQAKVRTDQSEYQSEVDQEHSTLKELSRDQKKLAQEIIKVRYCSRDAPTWVCTES